MTDTQMKHNQSKNRIRKCLAWLPAILTALAIFLFSCQPADASTAVSQGFTLRLLQLLKQLHLLSTDHPLEGWILALETPVRKFAHMFEFFVLYLTLLFALHAHNLRGKIWLRTALLMTAAYACTDEFHQLFVPGRAGRLTDVMIDCCLAALVTLLLSRTCMSHRDPDSH